MAHLIEAQDLVGKLKNYTILDVCRAQTYQQVHIPGALHFPLPQVMCKTQTAAGGLPPLEELCARVQTLGLTTDQAILVYDEEGGMAAGRVLWTLEYLGFQHVDYLNGGLLAWLQGQHPTQSERPLAPLPSQEKFQPHAEVLATLEDIEALRNDPNIILLDTRPLPIYEANHIPGALHFPTGGCIDQAAGLRLQPLSVLKEKLDTLGVTPDKTIICYCHAFHSAALVYMVLKLLGYSNVKGYVGSWSEWGSQ